MDLRNLNTFVQVAETGSFSRAGEKLGYSQPTVSVHIRQLEQELGIKLFDRVGHAVRLTERGRDILPHAQQICKLCTELQNTVEQKNAISGVVRIVTADSLCGPLLHNGFGELRKTYPKLKVELSTAGTAEIFRILDQNEADIGCILDSRIYQANYVISGEERIGVHFIVAADHPAAKAGVLKKEDMQSYSFFLTEKGMSYRRLLDSWLAQDAIELQPVLENGNAELLCRLVESGMGISFLPDYVTEQAVRRGTVVRLDAEGFQPELWKQYLYRRDKWVSQPMQAVLQYLMGIRLENEVD